MEEKVEESKKRTEPTTEQSNESPTKKLKKTKDKKETTNLVKKEKTPLSKFYKWTPQDDLLLIDAVQQGMEIEEIASVIKFSTKFKIKEIIERWRAVLFDQKIAEMVAKQIIILKNTTKRVPWSEEEDEIIKNELKSKGSVSFQHLLDKYRDKFHPSRTIRSLEAHFYRLKRSGNFTEVEHENIEKKEKDEKKDEKSKKKDKIDSIEKEEGVEKFSALEKEVLKNPKVTLSKAMIKEEKMTEKKESKRTLKLEKELQLNPKPEEEVYYAYLMGENVRFNITKQSTVIGRRDSKDSKVDINLSSVTNKNVSKISRKQAQIDMVIQKRNNIKNGLEYETIFMLKNEGKKSLFINDIELLSGETKPIFHNNMIIFPGEVRLLFSIHQNNVDQWTKKEQDKLPKEHKKEEIIEETKEEDFKEESEEIDLEPNDFLPSNEDELLDEDEDPLLSPFENEDE